MPYCAKHGRVKWMAVGAPSHYRINFPCMGISIIEIWRSWEHPILTMIIHILVRRRIHIETAPWALAVSMADQATTHSEMACYICKNLKCQDDLYTKWEYRSTLIISNNHRSNGRVNWSITDRIGLSPSNQNIYSILRRKRVSHVNFFPITGLAIAHTHTHLLRTGNLHFDNIKHTTWSAKGQ